MDKPLSELHVLLVEDEMMVLISIENMLADLGCASVTAAATVEQALSLIQAKQFDVAMLDVNLDGATSYPIADALAARAVPFLFATGYTDEGAHVRYPDRPVLNKPFPSRKLGEMLTRLVTH